MAIWCPPLPLARPSNCERQSSKQAQGTAVRSLYDELAETMAPLSDLLELGPGDIPETYLDDYLSVTQFLQNMQQLICLMDFKDKCYDEKNYFDVVQHVCHIVDTNCHDLKLCDPEMNICGSLLRDAGMDVGKVIRQIRALVLEEVQQSLGAESHSSLS